MFLDDDAMAQFDLTTISMGDKLEIKAHEAADGSLHATKLQLEDDPGYEIEGPVDAIDDNSIDVLGIVFGIDVDTSFEDGMPVAGNFVEVEDENADGVADSVELED